MREAFDELTSEQSVQNGTSAGRMNSISPSEEENSPFSNAASSEHGRMGEQLAHILLKRRFPGARCEWMNKYEESWKPYDFRIYDENDKIVRYVEVKTRVDDSVNVNQWIISRNEMQ